MEAVQLFFHEKFLISNRPLIKEHAQRSMMSSHYYALQILSPSFEIRKICLESLAYARVIPLQTIFPDQIQHKQTERYFIPWNVLIAWPKENLIRIEKYRKQALLYCPAPGEMDEHLDWFDADEITNSLTNQYLTIIAYQDEGRRINTNAKALSAPVFSEAILKWRDCGDHQDKDSPDTSLWNLDFSPKANQTIWEAWQIVLKTIREKEYLNRQGLLSIYRKLLQEQFFKGLDLKEDIQKNYLNKFEAKVFNTSPAKKKTRPGRWRHCQAISTNEAVLIIEYFIKLFLQDPKQKKFGEIACILWIMIWCAQEAPNSVYEKDITGLTIGAVDCAKRNIIFRGMKVRVSTGLIRLLHCLCGKGHPQHVLFQNVSPKILQRELAKASQNVLTGGMIVMPSAFLIIPHSFPGIRLEHSQRNVMINGREMIKPDWTRHQVLNDLKRAASA